MSPAPFVRRRDGTLELRLAPEEVDVLRPLLWHLLERVESEETAGDMRRLFPPAYPDDVEAQDEFAGLTTEDLVAGKRESIRAADATLERARLRRGLLCVALDEAEQQAWLGVLNDLRLVFGTRLDVTEGSYERPPQTGEEQVFLYLGWLEEHLVEQLLG